jgi:hypothetical protein
MIDKIIIYIINGIIIMKITIIITIRLILIIVIVKAIIIETDSEGTRALVPGGKVSASCTHCSGVFEICTKYALKKRLKILTLCAATETWDSSKWP